MSSSQSDSTVSPTLGKEKVDKTFLDTNFFSDIKILEIEAIFGDAAPAYYQLIALHILQQGAPIRFAGAVALLRRKQIGERAEEFLDYCVEVGLFYRDGELISSRRADKEIAALHEKREAWREYKRKPKRLQKDSNEIPKRIHLDSEEEEEHEEEQEKELNKKTVRPKKPAPEKREYQPFVHLTEAEATKVVEQFGKPFFDRCCQKLSAWIESDPTPKRKRNGTNAAATFRSWVFNAVSDEEARASRVVSKVGTASKNAIQANLDVVRRLQEEEADHEIL